MSFLTRIIVVFILTVLFEGNGTLVYHYFMQDKEWKCGFFAMLEVGIGAVVTLFYIDNKFLVLPDMVGTFVGTVLFMKLLKKYRTYGL